MLKTITTTLFTTSLLTLPMAVSAHSNHCQDTQLGEQMKSLKHSFKAYRQALSGEDWQQMAAARQDMLTLAAAAADEQPLKLHDLAPAHHPMMMQEYRSGLEQLNTLLTQLAQAEQAQDTDAATDLVGRIGQHSKQSHESLRKDCD
ncbi:MAG: hypothetical protein GYB41_13135 [Oceanospirillales bacterium]|nr:hypothetical protein [Oceanospirillales bacterium]